MFNYFSIATDMVNSKLSDLISRRFSIKKKTREKFSRSCSAERRMSTTLVRRLSRRFSSQKKVIYKCETSIAIFGGSKVGKTTIVNSLADFEKVRKVSYRPTITDTYKRSISLKSKNGKICQHQVKLVDTSGKIRTDYYPTFDTTVKSCEAFILVFSLDRKESLTEVEELLREINRVKKSTSTPVIFIATKSADTCKNSLIDVSERIKKLQRGLLFQISIDGDETCLDGFVSLLTEVERRKGIDRSFYGVEVL